MKILVVENSQIVRSLYNEILHEAGFEVIVAENGYDGIEKLSHFPDIGLIISDIELLMMNGISMIEKVRQENKFADVPIIITSSGYSTLDKQSCFAAGVDAFIFKPIEPEVLMENINLLTMN